MTIWMRAGVLGLVAIGLATSAGLPSVAQDPAPPSAPAAAPARKKADPAHRVPPYFGKIGLTPDQKAKIYGIQEKRQEKIDQLEQQIAAERAEMLAQCEGILTDTQKKLLENLRKDATEANAKSAEAARSSTAKPAK